MDKSSAAAATTTTDTYPYLTMLYSKSQQLVGGFKSDQIRSVDCCAHSIYFFFVVVHGLLSYATKLIGHLKFQIPGPYRNER